MNKKFIIISLIIISCNGQLADYFFPALTKTTREVADGLSKNPIVSLATETSGNILATAVNTFTDVPLSIARALGVGSELPTLISTSNLIEPIDNIIADFNAGLDIEDAKMDIESIILKYGYSVEEHEVITEDGYLLSMFRIPSNGSVVFLMHGLLGSADDYVVAGPDSGLAYLLADEGYDVWMGNARGNKHSRRHVELSPSDGTFWDFSWHEIGIYDLPAMIDYVLEETDVPSIKYIGHSQGTTTFFVMASEKPEYNKKISLMVALSPIAFMSNVRSPMVRLLSIGTPLLHGLTKNVGLYEFLPDNKLMRTLKLLMCGRGPLSEILCSNVVFLTVGFGFEQLNVTNLPVIYGHMPAGASAKQFAHYGQGVISGDFRKYDYGAEGNLERYGTEVPPSYALQNIAAPVSLFYSNADWLAHPTDVDLLYNKLDSAVDIYKIPYEPFNHVDFIWAKEFKGLVYERLRKLLKFF